MPTSSGAEQDRCGGWFGGDKLPSMEKLGERLPHVSGAEQDRYNSHFGDHEFPSLQKLGERLPQVSGAEQDRYNRWFGGDKGLSAAWFKDHLPQTSGAEQDRYARWWGGKQADEAATEVRNAMPQASGAEHDIYEARLGGGGKAPSAQDITSRLPRASGAEQDRYGTHFNLHPSNPINAATTTTLGLLQNAILPSFAFHAGLSTVTYAVARYVDRADAKDLIWSSAQVANAWWTAIGTRVVHDGLSVTSAWNTLGYTQKLLLTGVSAWGLRLAYHIAARSLRRGKDDDRYVSGKKKDPRFWDKAYFNMFFAEAVFQVLVSLPYTLPFQAPLACANASPFTRFPETFHSLAVFLFTTGFALETLADTQLTAHSSKSNEMCREGVWSIVRHPNYLGDAILHFSFPVLLYSAGMMHPLTILGPIFNYILIKVFGGDKENESNQAERYSKENPLKYQQLREYQREKNSFWPAVSEWNNKWVWIVAATGVGVTVVERGLLAYFRG